jgi:hypothetical protein
MRTSIVSAVTLCLVSTAAPAVIWDEGTIMRRGDADNNGTVDQADAVYISRYLFNGGPAPPCLNQADANDSGTVDGSDSTYLLNWLYQGGPAPPSPGPYNTECTTDESPSPGCDSSPC